MTTRRRALAFVSACALLPATLKAQRTPATALARAHARARAAALPLVIFVVPHDATAQTLRARLLAAFFDRGPRDALALLGDAELICASVDATRARFPWLGATEPFLFLTEPRRSPLRIRAFDTQMTGAQFDALYPSDQREVVARIVRDALADRGTESTSNDERADAYARFRERYLDQAIPGSYWGSRGTTCGSCGIGVTTRTTRRFLLFLTQPSRGRRE